VSRAAAVEAQVEEEKLHDSYYEGTKGHMHSIACKESTYSWTIFTFVYNTQSIPRKYNSGGAGVTIFPTTHSIESA
jgi:hypothetical protein